jgi:hypothetical protein
MALSLVHCSLHASGILQPFSTAQPRGCGRRTAFINDLPVPGTHSASVQHRGRSESRGPTTSENRDGSR